MSSKYSDGKWQEPVEFNNGIAIGAHNITQPHFAKINGSNYLFFW